MALIGRELQSVEIFSWYNNRWLPCTNLKVERISDRVEIKNEETVEDEIIEDNEIEETVKEEKINEPKRVSNLS